MTDPFKNLLDRQAIAEMGTHLARVEPSFDRVGFVAVATAGLDDLALKERSSRIVEALERFLPADFGAAARILVASLEPATDLSIAEMEHGATEGGIAGWPVMPMADYIARHGNQDVELSLETLREMTMRSSSEFAIRDFLIQHPEPTLLAMTRWCHDDNEHVRRLVSEGTRPRLPWGKRLHRFIEDPNPVLALLETLKDDPSKYVRRSVANSLNDIAKDHPDLVCDIARGWMKDATTERSRLIRHGLRGLIKAGNRSALETLGYGPPKLAPVRLDLQTPVVTLGETLEFDIEIRSTGTADQALMIDYIVHHVRANGTTTPKVFKWKTLTLPAGQTHTSTRKHTIKPITTRRYYPGQHRVEIQINGEILGDRRFVLRTD